MPDDMDTGYDPIELPEDEPSADDTPDETPAPSTESAPAKPGPSLSRNERMWGMACHLSGAAVVTCIPFINVLGPFVVWMLKREECPFADTEGKEAVNFQITIAIVMVLTLMLTLLLPWFVFLLFAIITVDLVFVLIASMNANDGRPYRYPIPFRFVL